MRKGVSLIELVVAMSVFTVLITSITLVLSVTLRSSLRSESLANVKSEGTYVMDSMSAILRFAKTVRCDPVVPNRVTATLFSAPNPIIYRCDPGFYIASDSSRLNSVETRVSGCEIICDNPTSPTSITIDFDMQDAAMSIPNVNFVTQLVLRNR
jgi:prepilin-type N-terminal cleavage/methylation domain-containing protein